MNPSDTHYVCSGRSKQEVVVHPYNSHHLVVRSVVSQTQTGKQTGIHGK